MSLFAVHGVSGKKRGRVWIGFRVFSRPIALTDSPTGPPSPTPCQQNSANMSEKESHIDLDAGGEVVEDDYQAAEGFMKEKNRRCVYVCIWGLDRHLVVRACVRVLAWVWVCVRFSLFPLSLFRFSLSLCVCVCVEVSRVLQACGCQVCNAGA